ncbi:TetR/AcrR family transcriptional regulator [Acinetobacter sp. S40]|uniref:TetR/AcrR family transcriptional regulator n=1 Tax=unclassified Acinetobacter TaxID=196816 RepID=UPI0019096D5F|nr:MULTISPECIES: TetR/AcrR family transcriptional regulator [unclassified Acinetobacter]MBJ9983843.1 TetR/AcrR family transcriptional regulator [Acinetobacter sp. S40]MBK0065033.1 TetR/AcrR family transcriptional regulator [Acinetobacter sp. S55]MBK0065307.1 TetR/AcrR family transcriptional regulator [Acinetobacter sp. S54]
MQNNIGRPKDLEKRARILKAAKAIFLKWGYHGSSMNQIATDAGVTKLTVYNHFQDKQSLFTCAIQETCAECISQQQFCLSPQSQFLDVFFDACECALNMIYLPEALKLEHVLLELATEKSPLAQHFFEASHQPLCDALCEFFTQAASLGFIRNGLPLQQTELILSLLLGIRHHQVLLGISDIPSAQEIRETVHFALDIFMLKYGV